jgi:hypothetical protein
MTASGWRGLILVGLIFAYWAAYLAMWWRVGELRSRAGRKARLATPLELSGGWAVFTYAWSDRPPLAGDHRLNRIVGLVRLTSLLLLASMPVIAVLESQSR